MVEVFKIAHNIYYPHMSLKLEYNPGCSTTGNKYKLLNYTHFTMIYENTAFLYALLTFGIAYKTVLSMLILLTSLKPA